MSSSSFKLHFILPIMVSIFMAAFIFILPVSLLLNHTEKYYPFISDAAALPPESCVFAQLFNIAALLFGVTVYIRYRQVKLAVEAHNIKLWKWNKIGLYLGLITSLGISVVSNFQEINVISVHLLGAFMAFGIGTTYFVIQTVITYRMKPMYDEHPEYGIGMKTIVYRTILTIICVTLCIIVSIFFQLANSQFKGTNMLHWTEKDGGYEHRVVAVFAEWALAIFFLLYAITAKTEFKLLELDEIRFTTAYKCDKPKIEDQNSN